MIGRPMMRRGRPGLLGTMARTAVVAGTATAVAGGVQRHQQNKYDQAAEAQAYEQQQAYAQPQAYAPPPPPAAAPPAPAPSAGPTEDTISQLQQLGELKAQGILTDGEFAAAKAKVLGLG